MLLDQELLRAMTDQQLLEHKTVIDQLMVNLPKISGTQISNPLAIHYVAYYLYRTAGFDRAFEFINALEQKESGKQYCHTKIL